MKKPVICFFAMSAGDWGGASRVLFTNLRLMNRELLTPVLLLPHSGPIEDELKQSNLQYQVWGPLTEPGSFLNYFKGFIRAVKFFRQKKIDVIHINSSNFWRPAELLAAWIFRIPVIAHYHVINDEPGPFMKLCRAAISVSQYTAKQSLPIKLKKPVIYNPIDLKRFDSGCTLRKELGIRPEQIVVVFLGQIREIKGVADFINMAHRISNPDVCFLIAGECRDPIKFSGSYTEQNLVDLAAGDTRIRYIGYVKKVENVYHTADIVVVPSRWQEPLGLINLEAGACYKPVVATRVGGIPEVIHDGENGFLVEPEKIEDLVARVDQLINNPNLRNRMGAAGRRLVENKFTTQPVIEFQKLLLSYVRHN